MFPNQRHSTLRFAIEVRIDDFQSILRTLKNLFSFFVLFHVRYHQAFRNHLHEVHSKFQKQPAPLWMRSSQKLNASFLLISLNETTS